MSPKERRARLTELGAELRTLEAKAGLTERMREAQERYHGDSKEQSHFYWRPIIREAYFSVVDPELRSALINKCAQCDSELEGLRDDELLELRQALEAATLAVDHLPWRWAAVVAIVPVAVGTVIAGVAGAFGGAVAGIFLGQGVMHKGKVSRAVAVRRAQAELNEQLSDTWNPPPTFTSSERHSDLPYTVTVRAVKSKVNLLRQLALEHGLSCDERPVPGEDDVIIFTFKQTAFKQGREAAISNLRAAIPPEVFARHAIPM